MKILICEDEKIQIQVLTNMISDYFENRRIPYTLTAYESAEQLLFHHELKQDFDILFLDIQMRGMSGIELAKQLRTHGNHAVIIFVTGNTDYIFESYCVEALNYLLKPIEQYKVVSCLDKAITNLEQEAVLLLQVDKMLVRIRYRDIINIKGDGHYVLVCTNDTVYRSKKSMLEIANELVSEQFYKVSRSDIVSLSAIHHMTSKEIRLINQEVIPIPKGKHREISEAFIKYHFHQGETL